MKSISDISASQFAHHNSGGMSAMSLYNGRCSGPKIEPDSSNNYNAIVPFGKGYYFNMNKSVDANGIEHPPPPPLPQLPPPLPYLQSSSGYCLPNGEFVPALTAPTPQNPVHQTGGSKRAKRSKEAASNSPYLFLCFVRIWFT